jgi:hypothetical protein
MTEQPAIHLYTTSYHLGADGKIHGKDRELAGKLTFGPTGNLLEAPEVVPIIQLRILAAMQDNLASIAASLKILAEQSVRLEPPPAIDDDL